MLLYLSLVRAVMGSSNAAPEISCGEKAPEIAFRTNTHVPLPPPLPTADILCSGRPPITPL